MADKQPKFISRFWRPEGPRVKALAASVSGERLLSPSRAGRLLPMFPHGGRGKGAPCELAYKGTDLVPKVSTLIT